MMIPPPNNTPKGTSPLLYQNRNIVPRKPRTVAIDAIINDLVVPFHYYGIRDKLVDYHYKDNLQHPLKDVLLYNHPIS